VAVRAIRCQHIHIWWLWLRQRANSN